jgi:hypothetical protein
MPSISDNVQYNTYPTNGSIGGSTTLGLATTGYCQSYPYYYYYPTPDPNTAKIIEQLLKRIADLEARLDSK